MFASVVKHMAVVEFDAAELQQPISLTEDDELATVAALIAEKAPAPIRAMFGDAVPYHVGHVRSVSNLTVVALRRIATALLRTVDPDHRVAAIGLGDFSPNQLIDEVARGTVMGEQIIDSVRLNGIFVEDAIKNGKIKPKKDPHDGLHIPDFEF